MEKKQKVRNMFDAIAKRYDFLNHALSLGIDIYWRKKALKLTKFSKDAVLLDVACGTGDFSIEAKKIGVQKIFGADLSNAMLSVFSKKSEWIRGNSFQMEAEKTPIKNETLTNVTVAFGVRNFYDIQTAFDSFYRTLKSGGKVTVLEFRLPSNKILKSLYQLYFRKALPVIGKLVSKHNEAYDYLPESVQEFDAKIKLPELFKNSGFKKIEVYSFTFGVVQTVIAEK